jgi:hypothetical protein
MRRTESGGQAEGGRGTQMLFCRPSIGKVGSGYRNMKKVFLYYDTNFSNSFASVPTVTKQGPSARYITDAGQLLRLR